MLFTAQWAVVLECLYCMYGTVVQYKVDCHALHHHQRKLPTSAVRAFGSGTGKLNFWWNDDSSQHLLFEGADCRALLQYRYNVRTVRYALTLLTYANVATEHDTRIIRKIVGRNS